MLQDLRYMMGETTFMHYTIKFKSVYKKNKTLNALFPHCIKATPRVCFYNELWQKGKGFKPALIIYKIKGKHVKSL